MVDPSWLDRGMYPFASQWFDTVDGRMHYLDEGKGRPVVLVHGTPTWSFLYRHLVRALRSDHRVIVPDHLGFGLSDKPPDAPYRPVDHARRLGELLDSLDLEPCTMMVHDFGGPIGLARAIERPDTVEQLVISSTWMWSLADDPRYSRPGRFLGSALGRFLYRWLNFSPRVLLPMATAEGSKIPPEVHLHYLRAFSGPSERWAPWTLARELIGSSNWYESLWERRCEIAPLPALLLWGDEDPAFGTQLERWHELFPAAEIVKFPGAGHFLQEEVGPRLVEPIRRFLAEPSFELPHLGCARERSSSLGT